MSLGNRGNRVHLDTIRRRPIEGIEWSVVSIGGEETDQALVKLRDTDDLIVDR